MTTLPKRRPLSQANITILDYDGVYGIARVQGEVFAYQCMVSEPWEALLKYVPASALEPREFLFDGTWVGVSHEHTGEYVYLMGWPGDPKIEVVGPKAAAAALRRYWPLRNHAGTDDGEDSEPVTSPKVVPLVQANRSAAEIRHQLAATDPDWSPGKL